MNPRTHPAIRFDYLNAFPGLELETALETPTPLVPQLLTKNTFSLCLKGPATAWYHGQSYGLRDGTFQSYGVGVAFAASPARGNVWSYQTLRINQDLLATLAKAAGHRLVAFSSPVMTSPQQNAHLGQLFEDVCSSIKQNDSASVEEHLYKMGRALLRDQPEITVHAGLSERAQTATETAKDYLTEHFRECVPLDALADLTTMSKFHLHKLFRQVVGLPPHVFQASLRIEEAKRLLRKLEPIAHIAIDLGFADQGHFIRTFKQYVGVTPGQYQAFA